jgi:hypothetical protein
VIQEVPRLGLSNGTVRFHSRCLSAALRAADTTAQAEFRLTPISGLSHGPPALALGPLSARPDSGNARLLHFRDRHQHTFDTSFHPFLCPVLTLVQLSGGERFSYSRLTNERDHVARSESDQADTQGVNDMNDNDEWVSYSHWGMFPLE